MTGQGHAGDQYRAVFEAAGDGMVIVDAATLRIVEANAALCRMVGYAREELLGMRPASLVDHRRLARFEGRARFAPDESSDTRVSLVGVRKDGSRLDVEVQVQSCVFEGSSAYLGVVRDVTQRVRAFELLQKRVSERTTELAALLDVSQTITATLELEPLLGHILDQLGNAVGYTRAAIMLVEGDELCVGEYRGSIERDSLIGLRLPLSSAVVFQAVVRQGGPVIIGNTCGDSEIAQAYRAFLAEHQVDAAFLAPQSVLAVPLKVQDRLIGQLRLDHDHVEFYNQEHAALALALANQAAVAIENARLFKAERLNRERLEVALEAGQMGTWEWDVGSERITWSPQLARIHGFEAGRVAQSMLGYLSGVHPDDRARVDQALARALQDGSLHLEYQIVWSDGSTHWVEARGRVMRDAYGETSGMRGVCLDISARKQAEAEHSRVLENERRMLEVNAALEERQRLARELHDSVSQALYGIGLGAQTALGALEADHDEGAAAHAVRYTLSLAEAGLTEMRALIFELRPEVLEQEGLIAALDRNAATLRARHAIRVSTRLPAEPNLPYAAKEALYRIAQEALNNTVKHAHARSVKLSVRQLTNGVVLEINDDGVGFDPVSAHPGHLGLTSMRERAGALGGHLTIRSALGRGTRIAVRLPYHAVRGQG